MVGRRVGWLAMAVVSVIYGRFMAGCRYLAAYATASTGRGRFQLGIEPAAHDRTMFEFKKTNQHQKRRILLRIWVAGIFALICFSGLVGRLWYLQVVRYE